MFCYVFVYSLLQIFNTLKKTVLTLTLLILPFLLTILVLKIIKYFRIIIVALPCQAVQLLVLPLFLTNPFFLINNYFLRSSFFFSEFCQDQKAYFELFFLIKNHFLKIEPFFLTILTR